MMMMRRCYSGVQMCCSLCRCLWRVEDLLAMMPNLFCWPLAQLECETWKTSLGYLEKCVEVTMASKDPIEACLALEEFWVGSEVV